MGMLTSEDLAMSPEEFSKRIPGPGSYWYNIYAKEAPELLAQAEAIRAQAQQETRGYVPTAEDNAQLASLSGEERRYQELLNRGVIDEQGNILKPDGINVTEIMRGDPPSWASPELIKNAYILAFESKARGGQDFMESGDYQNFLDAGYSLTEEQMNSLGGVQGQGNQDDLTFGGGQSNTGVANPQPPAGNPPEDPFENIDYSEGPDLYQSSGNAFMDAYGSSRANAAQVPAGGTSGGGTNGGGTPAGGTAQSTPFADAYIRAKAASEKKGPVSSLFGDMLGS